MTYTCTDPTLLKKLNTQLEAVMNDFRRCLPESEGLIVLPALQERVKQAARSNKIRSLPLYKKPSRKRLDSAYRNRVGRKANALRKVDEHSLTHVHMHLHCNYVFNSKSVGSKGASSKEVQSITAVHLKEKQ